MRTILFAVLALVAPASAAPSVWTAACSGQEQVQYQQTINGDGYLHLGQSGGYSTVKVKQSFFNGSVVCGSIPAKAGAGEVAAVCADNVNQKILILNGAEKAKGIRPEKAPVYCDAVVSAF